MDTHAAFAEVSPLVDLIWLWRVDPNGHRELLLEEAASAVAGDSDAVRPAMVALARDGEEASRAQMALLVDAVAAEEGLEHLAGTALQDRAVEGACRRHLAGALSERELTYWVARVVGLRGSARTQPFLGFEDEYTRFMGYDVSAIDADVTAAAQAFIAPPPEVRPGLWTRLRRQR